MLPNTLPLPMHTTTSPLPLSTTFQEKYLKKNDPKPNTPQMCLLTDGIMKKTETSSISGASNTTLLISASIFINALTVMGLLIWNINVNVPTIDVLQKKCAKWLRIISI